jgi:hypothetical protein
VTGFSHAERLTAVEVRVKNLETKVDDLKADVQGMDRKLDELLALKDKGVGAFWLISALTGTGIISFLLTVFHYLTGGR